MKVITDLTPQAKNPKRLNLYLDGSYYCGLDILTAAKYRLKVGASVEEGEIIAIQREAEYRKAFDYALKVLSNSMKTEKEVKDKLSARGYLDEIVFEVIAKVKEYGFISDSEYAKKYAAAYANKKGKNLIKTELKRKGVSDDDIAAALSENDETDACEQLAEKYFKNKEKSYEPPLNVTAVWCPRALILKPPKPRRLSKLKTKSFRNYKLKKNRFLTIKSGFLLFFRF